MKLHPVISTVALSIALLVFSATATNSYQTLNNSVAAAQPSIEQLLAQLKSLQAQLAAKQAQVTTTYQFTRVLKVGDKGDDVRQLQILLNKDTLTQIAVSGDGSPGKETTYFGPATSRAVAKFQEKYKSEILTPNQLTKGTGFVGGATVKKLNSLLAVKLGTTTTVVTNQNPTQTNTTPTQTNTIPTQTNATSTSSSLLPPTNCGAPIITSAGSASGTVGSTFNYIITITSIAAPIYSVSGLPTGLTLSGSSIVGTPTVAGTYSATITANSICGSGTKTVSIIISSQQTPTSGTIITPGSGFSGATAQPATIGSGPGSDAKVIARWDVIPYQVFSGNFNVGIVAFHINDIDHIAFSANGGPWTNIYSMSLNTQLANNSDLGAPSTGVNEYFATLRASDFKDGAIEVRAIAYPKVGIPRLMDSLILYANSGGTQTPVSYYVSPTGDDTNGDGTEAHPWQTLLKATISGAPGSIVYLKPGNYGFNQRLVSFRDDGNKWQVFQPAPGVTRNQVVISTNTNDSMRAGKTEFYNVRIDMTKGVSFFGFGGLWLNNVEAYGASTGPFGVSPLSGDQNGPMYVERSDFHDMYAAAIINGAQLIRNYKIYHCYAHGLNDPGLAVNGIIDDLRTTDDPAVWGTPEEAHLDGVSWGMGNDGNSIVYNLTMTRLLDSLGFLSYYGFSNLALVNTTITTSGTGPGGQSQFDRQNAGNYNHVYVDNVVLNDQSLWFDDRNGLSSQWSNSIVKNSKATLFTAPFPVILLNNRLINGTPVANQSSIPSPTVSLSASQTNITAGSSVTLTWSSANSTSCSASNGWSGTQNTSGNQSTGNLSNTTTYTLTCSGAGGSATQSVTITVSPVVVMPPAAPNLILQYAFDGTTNDSSQSGNAGTANGNPTYGTGKYGQAIQFNGSNFVDTNQSVPLTGSFTFSAWINGSDFSRPYWTYSFLSGTSQLTMMAVYNYALYLNVGSNHFGSISMTTNSWNHVVGVYNSSTQRVQLYVNGVLDKDEADTGAPASQRFRIGARGDRSDAYTFSGFVDDVRIYNRALTATEVQQLYNGTLAVQSNKKFMASVWDGFVETLTSVGNSLLDISHIK